MLIHKLREISPDWLVRCIFTPIAHSPFVHGIIYFFRCCPWLSDEDYLRKYYQIRFGTALNLENPVLFNEKNNWRKLYDRKPIYTDMVDKYRIKEMIAERIGSEHAFPLLASWKAPKDIDLSTLPNQFVLKCNHAGGVIICRDKTQFNFKKAQSELKRTLKTNYYWASREWPYKDVERRIICEAYMGEGLIDYKIYCFNGEPIYIFVWKNIPREDGRKPEPVFMGAYDWNWNKISIKIGYPSTDEPIDKPCCMEELYTCAKRMSQGTTFVRVDCYIISETVYIGELTFFPWGGFMKFQDEAVNRMLGDLEQLDDSTQFSKENNV